MEIEQCKLHFETDGHCGLLPNDVAASCLHGSEPNEQVLDIIDTDTDDDLSIGTLIMRVTFCLTMILRFLLGQFVCTQLICTICDKQTVSCNAACTPVYRFNQKISFWYSCSMLCQAAWHAMALSIQP